MSIKSLCLFALVVMSACTSVVSETVERLDAISPLTADPAHFEVAVFMPDGLDIPEGGGELVLSATWGSNGDALNERFRLERSRGEALTFRIAAGDLARFRAAQARVLSWKDGSEGAGTLSLSVAVKACTYDGGPKSDARIAVDIRVEPGADFLPLLRNAPLSKIGAKPQPCAGKG